jgi:single-stranded DNA-binding protein
MSLNLVALAGRLVASPEPLARPTGETVGARFILETEELIPAEDGGHKTVVHHAHVRVLEAAAVPALVAMPAGATLCVVGVFFVHEWLTPTGEKKRATYIRAERWGATLNLAVIKGNLGADPEYKPLGDTGRHKASVRLATNPYLRDPETGEGSDELTHWVGADCFWQSKAKAIADHCAKGQELTVVGRYIEEVYTPKEGGAAKPYAFVKVEQFDFSRGGAKQASAPAPDGQPPRYDREPAPPPEFDDIPF